MSEWINVNDKLPEENIQILVYDCISNVMTIGRRQCEENDEVVFYIMSLSDTPIDFNVTHWMSFPKTPTKRFMREIICNALREPCLSIDKETGIITALKDCTFSISDGKIIEDVSKKEDEKEEPK